ncbi:hypothetical protein GG804_17840 [Sphingomonas histidinilytica]|jgi:two-component sensor histidine kinase|uniref:histidine kinase n=1 Tax=Rhizorhabdus histidinilytica TaxID=439228 RepID=A0A1T5GG57_9SPHN|nr:HWE histidine kinase domain-containing protein [Rhizorhabdus histidinilytica]MBO9378634.1 hypothetical protein [Rhizorhabdus histidinilytica]QEH77712.1 hypothetical protein EIK56_05890 [Sphingomonas sp. C8-2]SKC07385.1 Two-component sensor histidine kinase, contains HisKA and HATPase domains [Rhizorhabdus histidinilytica]
MTDSNTEIAALREALRSAETRHAEDSERIRRLEQDLQEVRQEARHSMRNILSVVRSIARRSVASARSIEEYRQYMDGRIGAFARVQSAISRHPGRGVDLGSLVADELVSFGVRLDGQATIEGEAIRLRDKPAGLLGLAFHELVVNSLTFGALAAEGQLHITWRRQAEGPASDLWIQWAENRVAPGALSRQPKRGFGSQVLEEAVAYELAGSTQIDLSEKGLVCSIRLPASCLA